MKQPSKSPSDTAEPAGDRGDVTRQKLLTAAIDVFGQYGFDGTTTRALASAAGVNLQAIPYYFGGKEGLYLAAAEHLAALISSHVGSRRQQVQDRLAEIQREGRPVTREEARELLTALLNTLAEVMVSEKSRAWARFLIREQMAPTEAFSKVYEAVIRPMVEAIRRLVGVLLDMPPTSEPVGLRALSLIGSVLVFRVANAAALRQLEWSEMGPKELDAIRANVADIVRALHGGGAK
jgi:TetR/AcrR family transcriptional regulator, regulator of cefoperazone and chloramphenicol sensitivity